MVQRWLAAACLLIASGWAQAQAWPTKPVRIVVPFAPGGLTDVVARTVADRLAESLGQQFLVENKAGAGGNLGAESVVKSPADGYTLLLTSQLLALNKSAYRQISYDVEKDLVPVGEIGTGVVFLVLHPGVKAGTVPELIALMKAQPGKLNFATPGSGPTTPYFQMASGTQFTTVPYKGNVPALTDLIAGQVDALILAADTVMPHVIAGKVKVLAVTSSTTRSRLYPDIPTVAETLPGFASPGFLGLTAPRGTPPEVIQKLNTALRTALAHPDVRLRFEKIGIEPVDSSPEQFGRRITAEVQRWAPIVKATNSYLN